MDILDEIEQERSGATTSASPGGKTRPTVASKPSHLKKERDSALFGDEDWAGDDADFSGADLLITQKPKRSSDMADPRAVVDRIFNEESDVAW